MTRVEIFENLVKKASDTYKAKNADYGDSFVKVRQKYPNSILIRLNDKLSRLETLIGKNKEAEVKSESIDDTLLDLANYALMELTERIYEKQSICINDSEFNVSDHETAIKNSTYKDIINALNVCTSVTKCDCSRCYLLHYSDNCDECINKLMLDAKDLITNQHIENEKLNESVSQAVKNFAKKLKGKTFTHKNFGELIFVEDVDEVLKETTGEKQ